MKQPSAKSKKRGKRGKGVKKKYAERARLRRSRARRKREKVNSKRKEIGRERVFLRGEFHSCLAFEGVFFSSRPRELFSALIVYASPLKWPAN